MSRFEHWDYVIEGKYLNKLNELRKLFSDGSIRRVSPNELRNLENMLSLILLEVTQND